MDYDLESNEDPSVLKGYTYASWIPDQEDYASTSGWIFTLGWGVVSWGSKKHSCLTDSAMAVEFMALASCCKEAELLRDLLINITLWPKPMPLIFVYCDSQSTLSIAYNQVYNGKSRHIGLRHRRVNQLINDGVITTWMLWGEVNPFELLDESLKPDYSKNEVLRCIQIGYYVCKNNQKIDQRQSGAFPGDLSLGIPFPGDLSPEKRRWGRLVKDSFPSDNLRRK
nr:zinc finger, CCHC-type [Tanacetum cinerariifolium]